MFSRLDCGAKVMFGWEELQVIELRDLFQWAQANFGGRLTICLRTLTWTGKGQECFRIFIEFKLSSGFSVNLPVFYHG